MVCFEHPMNKMTFILDGHAPLSKAAPLFGAELERLKNTWFLRPDAAGSTPGGYYRTLRQKLGQLANGKHGQIWYLPHQILTNLIDGSSAALEKAKQDFLREWAHGDAGIECVG
jgi:hypothetical protein